MSRHLKSKKSETFSQLIILSGTGSVTRNAEKMERVRTKKDKQEVREIKTVQTTKVSDVEPFRELFLLGLKHCARSFSESPALCRAAFLSLWNKFAQETPPRGILSSLQHKTNKAPSILDTNHTFPTRASLTSPVPKMSHHGLKRI